MNWYKIIPCPKYAIREDGEVVANIKTMHILHHNSTSTAKDKLKRITLYYNKTYLGKLKAYRQVYTLKYLKETFIKNENLINIDESKLI